METLTAPTAGQPVIEVNDLVRRYGKDFVAVDSVTFEVKSGEVFGLLGTNGAGKTSTMEILEGLARGDSGSVRVWGKDPLAERDQIRPFQGVMMQTGGFPTDLTVRETLTMWAGTLSHPRDVDETLEAVDLDHRANVRVKGLSGGEIRRLDLACAIVGQPRLLFLDEPTTGLDPQSRRTCWSLIEQLNHAGTTVVLTTHYLEEADRLCDRLLIMHEGKIARYGTHAEVVSGYPAQISFGFDERWFEQLPGAIRNQVTRTQDRVNWQTQRLQRDLSALLEWANQSGVQLTDLSAHDANLETVFLEIAGTKQV